MSLKQVLGSPGGLWLILMVVITSGWPLGCSGEYSGDGAVGFGSVIEDEERTGVVSGSAVSISSNREREDLWIEDDDEDSLEALFTGPHTFSRTSTHAPIEIVTRADDKTTDSPPFSASSASVIITVIVIALVLLSCCAWRVFQRRTKRAAKERRSLRNHAIGASLLASDKPYKGLVEVEVEVEEDLGSGVGERKSAENKGLPVTLSSSTAVAMEDHEALSKRLSPPPSYEEYMKSTENLEKYRNEHRLSDLGPSYR